MRRKVQIEFEGATLIYTVEDPMDGGEWYEVDLQIEGPALRAIEKLAGKYGAAQYDTLLDRVHEEVIRQRRSA